MDEPQILPRWPFDDPPDAEVITLDRILEGRAPILLVTHDDDEGEDGCAWQFLDDEHVFEDDARVVLLGEIVQLDPSLAELADLPPGHFARRPDPSSPWTRSPGEP
jgi:hypothetical protein